MGGRRDPRGRFQPSMPRVSRNTTVESATARPPISQNVVSTLVDQATIDAAQKVHSTVCSHILRPFDLKIELELTSGSRMILQQ